MNKKQNLNITQNEEKKSSQEEQNLTKELIPICQKCSSNIELISIDEIKTNEEINQIIKYRCIKEKTVNQISFKDYIKLIKEKENNEKNQEDLKAQCEKHQSKNFISYCFDCNSHLCEDCLKASSHLMHIKNNIVEIEPLEEELNVIKNVIDDYKLRLKKIIKEKENKKRENEILFQINKKNLEKKIDNIKEKNKQEKNLELENNKRKYKKDIDNLKKEFENKIRERKKEYLEENNKIKNKYKLTLEKIILAHNNKIEKLINHYEKEIDKYKFEKKIENYNNMIKINIMFYDSYNKYKNNYYNSININSLLLYHINNDYINNNIMKVKLKDKYDYVVNLIKKRNEREHQKIDELKNEIKNFKNEIENKYKKENELLNEKNKQFLKEIENLKKENEKYIKLFKDETEKLSKIKNEKNELISKNTLLEKEKDKYKNLNINLNEQLNQKLSELDKKREQMQKFKTYCETVNKGIKSSFDKIKNIKYDTYYDNIFCYIYHSRGERDIAFQNIQFLIMEILGS